MRALGFIILLPSLALIFLGISGICFTGAKLDKMKKIRGYKPGAVIEDKIITDKFVLEAGSYGPSYWVSWDEVDIRIRSDFRLSLEVEKWKALQIGDSIEVTFVPPDSSPYSRDGVFASDGNFGFDRVLLGIEVAMVIAGTTLGVGGLYLLATARLPGQRRANKRMHLTPPPLEEE